MAKYYERSVEPVSSIVTELQRRHDERLHDLETAGQRTLDSVWWPFVQHTHVKSARDVMVIDSAHADSFAVVKPNAAPHEDMIESTFDGSASWWTQAFGHANQDIALAAARAAGRYGHVMFPTATHAPALRLTERLLSTVGKGWASRVFFSDDGSTGMEIALKMALRLRASQLKDGQDLTGLGMLGLDGGYHGDTIGAMDAVSPSAFNQRVEWYSGRGFWFDPPLARIEDGKVVLRLDGEQWADFGKAGQLDSLADLYDVDSRLRYDPLAPRYRMHILAALKRLRRERPITFGALLLEPVVMGAGGMLFVDPLFQRILVDLARSGALLEAAEGTSAPLPVIFDEVFVGLRRIGPLTAASLLGVQPDVACYAKVLTGGLVPMAVTLASDQVFQSFSSDRKVDALLHGHSYTAHAVGCAAANKALDLIDTLDYSDSRRDWGVEDEQPFSVWSRAFVERISSMPRVEGVMALGTVLAVHLRAEDGAGYSSTASQDVLDRLRASGIHARPLGSVVYLMSSLNTTRSALQGVETALGRALE